MFSDYISRLVQELQLQNVPQLSSGQSSFGLELKSSPITIYDAAPGIRIDSKLGPLPQVQTDQFMAKMLQGNFLGQLTRKAALGLNEEGKEVILTLFLPVVRNYREFRDNLEDFVNTVAFWKDEMARHPGD